MSTAVSPALVITDTAAPYGILGNSPAMRRVMELVADAASSRSGVLISGEPGTGREVVARAIHAQGAKPHAPFVKLDCGKISAQDLQVELLGGPPARGDGHVPERRAFERIARSSGVYLARGGTLFLEHVAEMPTGVQAKLARLLRDREAVLAEDGHRLPLDVRAIASVDSSLQSAVDEGRVRADLFKRLSTIRIDLPPLRSRREDIPALAAYFIEDICRAADLPVKTLTGPAQTLLAALPFRGNAWELRRLLEGLVLMVSNRTICMEDVLASVRLDGGVVQTVTGGTLREARARFEREYIASVLDHHHGRIREAARALGIQRTNLYRKMRRLHISRAPRKPLVMR